MASLNDIENALDGISIDIRPKTDMHSHRVVGLSFTIEDTHIRKKAGPYVIDAVGGHVTSKVDGRAPMPPIKTLDEITNMEAIVRSAIEHIYDDGRT